MSSACCNESSAEAVAAGGAEGEIMLFGVRVKVDPMRKSVSLNNLSQYEQPNANNNNESSKVAEEGYASADDVVQHQSNSGRERKRGVPWTEEEHKLFLLGLQKVGKGDWRGISRNFVKTRTPTQVASHAQKYFLRRSNLNRRRRRSSLFDITTDSVSVMPIEEGKNKQEIPVPAVLTPPTLPTTIEATKTNAFPVVPIMLPAQIDQSRESPSLLQRNQVNSYMPVRPVPMLSMPNRSTVVDLNVNQNSEVEPLSLRLSLSLDQGQASSTRHSAFKVMSSFSNGENIISVA
ncbi:PREDICTED: transcription factor MYB1R1-like [Nicotiana attenuata]|uniref:Transcription factor myb1r1 n=1 Tax=Nicotiana attenuata TaxID=49451 RepID=A0A314L6M2_NICAT|nr:PREDICTED: transcription factor MYB1R1-like [Nicotiana attenuata]OIT36747.1 transcription factor myb1r1 [Nicotiana attenuata]